MYLHVFFICFPQEATESDLEAMFYHQTQVALTNMHITVGEKGETRDNNFVCIYYEYEFVNISSSV